MKKYIILIPVVIFLLLMAFAFVPLREAFFRHPAANDPVVSLTIPQGSGVKSVASLLKEHGLISSTSGFSLYVKWFQKDVVIQAGDFSLQKNLSYREILWALRGAARKDVSLTIPEGLTLAQIGERVTQALPGITLAEWNTTVGIESSLKREGLGRFIPSRHDLEGYLFPDTYRFRPDASASDVARLMLATLARRLDEADIHLDESGKIPDGRSLHEVLTLAAVVEREVRGEEDKRMAADLFLRRMEAGIALQADSTVNYITGGKDPSVSGRDLMVDSPYNTYRVRGLPPGPISHPGLESILAVIHPKPNTFFYFLTTEEGRVIYSETYEEHLENKWNYLR